LRLFSFGGYGLALVALALVVFGAYDSYPVSSKCASAIAPLMMKQWITEVKKKTSLKK